MSSSSSVTAPSPDSNSTTTPAPPPPAATTSPPTPLPSSPPPTSSPSPPAVSPPSNATSSPPPPSTGGNPPPPPSSNDASPPPPPPNSNVSNPPPSDLVSPPPPPHSSSSATPPPPPRSIKSPPSHSNTSSSTSSNSDMSASTKQLIIGITVGVGLFLLALIVICLVFGKKKKRKHDHMQYYGGDPSHDNNTYYNNNPSHQNWNMGPQGTEHVVRLNPPPGGGGVGPWPSPPPPLPPGMNSGEMSSNYSGPRHPPLPPPSPSLALGFNKSTFTYDELAAATGGFSHENLLGQGGFGYVHKGVLPNGKQVAVKSLKSGSGQGEREFQAEVEIISRVHHRHLVSLVGYCIAGGQRMLVYEFVPNNTLEHHLHGKGLPTMDWPTRLRIATGSAKGLGYLHEDCHPRIIHRDIKAANILLDYNFEAMVADFGLAKLSSDNYTHVSTRVMGTFGYLAPEYASSGKLTEKSDVFSYGVMLLELITGHRPVDPNSAMDESLVDWARPLLQLALENGVYDELVDKRLEDNYNPHEMARMVACAAASIRHSARKRPRMSQIVRALEGDVSLDDLNEGVRPGHSSIYTSSGSSDYDANAYNADMKKFRKMALTSQEFVSSEFGTSTSGDSHDMSNPGHQKQNFGV
ncbi:proline-rich receptor-like protein kinase PERK4 [Humulus lupulus]|uniref:proline-rich receptor-like protein kinase PERK4 n=1 Tax=Humulus lupulus TaxID=3486 RepID=UPI002B40FEB0|nr:proline-rich receptor-like protein kinase PERK4 [Humulus lupulus]